MTGANHNFFGMDSMSISHTCADLTAVVVNYITVFFE